MQQIVRISCGVLAVAALAACVVVPERRPPPPQARVEIRFQDRQREMAREYYRENDRHRDRRQAPEQARKWRRGEPLPRDVAYQPVPRDLEARIGPPPRGYRYVDVAGDILMIAIGTAVVVDAIQDLNR